MTIVLSGGAPFLIFQRVRIFSSISPPNAFLRLIRVNSTTCINVFVQVLLYRRFRGARNRLRTLCAKVIDMPIIIRVIFMFVQTNGPRCSVFLFKLKRKCPLSPRATSNGRCFRTVFDSVIRVTHRHYVLGSNVSGSVIAISFLRNCFPFAITFLSVINCLQGRHYAILRARFANIFSNFKGLIMPVYRRILYGLFKDKRRGGQCAARFHIPVDVSTVFFSNRSFKTSI